MNINGASFSSTDGIGDDSMTNSAMNGPAPIAVYLYAGDQIVENVTTGYLYFQDSLGNTSHVTDASGNLLESYTYSAFGQPSFFNSTSQPLNSSTYDIRHLFQGQLWTQETGLNDYRNRVELPAMGVFLQPDPIGFKGDAANVYRFCNNNAVNRVDPMGLFDVVQIDFNRGLQGPGRDSAQQMAENNLMDLLREQMKAAGKGFFGQLSQSDGVTKEKQSASNSQARNQPGKPDHAIRSIDRAYGEHDPQSKFWWARVFWRIQLFHYNQQHLGRGIQFREQIQFSKGDGFTQTGYWKGAQPTRDDGSVDDPWGLCFNKPDGHVVVTQTIFAGGREATWRATVNAKGEYYDAQQYIPFHDANP